MSTAHPRDRREEGPIWTSGVLLRDFPALIAALREL